MTLTSASVVIACAADAGYALPLAVMLNSMGSHAAAGIRIEAYVLDDGIAAADKDRVAASVPSNIRLVWRQPVSSMQDLPTWGRMSSTTYQKLTLDEWLPPDLGRVIWLDCDLLVLDDIGELWRAPMQASIVMAAQDQRVPMVSSQFGVAAWRQLGMGPQSKYFNAGVLLVDLARWRERQVRRRSIEYLRSYAKRVYFWDQEALNAVLADAWGELDPQWNCNPMLARLPAPGDGAGPIGQRIVHFSGSLKPWKSAGSGRWREFYLGYMDRTAWAGARPKPRWRDGILDWYEASALRWFLYPAEQFSTRVLRAFTRSRSRPKLKTRGAANG